MPLTVDDAELLRRVITSFLSDVWTSEPAIVKSYDGSTRTADVQPAVKRAIPTADDETEHETLPIVPNVPVLFPQAGPMLITFPITAGDEGILICSSSATGPFRETGQVSEPGDLRKHGLGAAFFWPSGLSKGKVTGAQGSAAALVLNAPAIVLGAHTATLYAAIGDYVDARLATIQDKHDTHTHAVSGGVANATLQLIGPLDSVKSDKVKIES